MKTIDFPIVSLIQKGLDYDLTIEDFEKVVAYKVEIVKFMQTYRLSLMLDKIKTRDMEIEKSLGSQIDVLSLVMDDLNLRGETLLSDIKKREQNKIIQEMQRK